MTDVAVAFCPNCGAVNAGTRFCESCGQPFAAAPAVQQPAAVAPAVPAPVPVPVPAPAPAPFAYGGSTGVPRRTPLYVIALVGYALLDVLPDLIYQTAGYSSGAIVGVRVTDNLLIVVVGLLVLIGALVTPPSSGAKIGGALLAVAYLIMALLGANGVILLNGGLVLGAVVGAIAPLLIFLSWAVGRPFRGPGYLGVLVGVVLLVIDLLIVQFSRIEYTEGGWLVSVLLSLVVTLGTVGFALLVERRPAAQSIPVASAWTGAVPPLAMGPTNSLARTALVLAIIPFGLQPLSIVAFGSGSVVSDVLSFIDLGLLIAALICGHIALRQIRLTGQSGRGMALAAVIIGWVEIGISVIAIIYVVVVFISVAAASSSLYGY